MTLLITVAKTTYSQSALQDKIKLDYKIDTGIRLHPGLVRKATHGQIEKDIVQWVMDNFDTIGTAGSGFNLSNHSLTANGAYLHNWSNYPLAITGLGQLYFQDSENRNILSSGIQASIIASIGQFSASGKYGITINKNTGEIMIDSAYYLPTVFGGGIGAVLQKTGTFTTAWNVITNISLITSYNGGSTAGNGLFVIKAHGKYENITTSIIVTTYTPSIDGDYYISAYLNPSIITGTLNYDLTFTDKNGIANDYTLNSSAVTTTGTQSLFSTEIQAKGGTAITLKVTLSGGTANYDVSGTITNIDN